MPDIDNDDLISALKATSTHSPEQPNPAQPYLDMVNQYMQGGVPEVLKNRGVSVPDWVNKFGSILQNPDNQTILGMAAPWAGKLPGLASEGKSYSQMAKELDVTRNQVAGEMYRQGLTAPKAVAPLSNPDIWNNAKSLKSQGYSFNEISKMLGVSPTEVGRSFSRVAGHERAAPGLPSLDFMKGPAEAIDPKELTLYLKTFGGK